MSKVSWRFRKALGHPLTAGLVLVAMNFLAIVFFHPNTYIMGLATLAIFGCGAFILEHGWISAFVEGETTAESQGLRRVLDFVVVGTIVLLMIFGGHHEFLSGPTARFRVVTVMMTATVWIGYLVIWLHIRDRRSWDTIVANTATR